MKRLYIWVVTLSFGESVTFQRNSIITVEEYAMQESNTKTWLITGCYNAEYYSSLIHRSENRKFNIEEIYEENNSHTDV